MRRKETEPTRPGTAVCDLRGSAKVTNMRRHHPNRSSGQVSKRGMASANEAMNLQVPVESLKTTPATVTNTSDLESTTAESSDEDSLDLHCTEEYDPENPDT